VRYRQSTTYLFELDKEKMTTEEILKSLCYYDKRNPDCTADDEDIEYHKSQLLKVSKKLGYDKGCSCENCFYGRTRLAEELLKFIH
jgi:hypothetical protein